MASARNDDDRTRDALESAADLAKTMGRLSLAMGAFAARQAGRVLSEATAETSATFGTLSSQANNRVAHAIRSTVAVGANLQSGLVDACVNAAGLGPARQTPTGATTALKVSLSTAASRRVAGMQTVAEGARDSSVTQAEFLTHLRDYHRQADEGTAWDRRVAGLWRSEGLAGSVARHLLPENHMNDPSLPREMLPVIHVGMGSGSAETLAFDRAKLDALFDERCSKNHLEFSYEGVGATLRFYERGLFKLASGMLDFIDLGAADGPDPAGFFAEFLRPYPTAVQRVIAHGYGRIVAFSNLSVYDAIEEATALPCDRVEPAVHGVAFAFAMINSVELPRILSQSEIPYESGVRAAFQNGLIYALVFLDWYAPGVLERWDAQTALEAELIEHARREAGLSRARGFPLAFRLADPRR